MLGRARFDEVGEAAEGRLERLGLLRGGTLAGRLDGTGPLEPEQWCLVVRGEHDLHVREAVEDRRQGEQGVVGCVGQGQASAGERGVRAGPEGGQQTGAGIIGASAADPDDHSLRSFGDGGLEELPDTPRAREAGVSLVRGEEVQAGGLARLHVCRPPASVVDDEDRGGHLAAQGVADRGRDGGPAEGPLRGRRGTRDLRRRGEAAPARRAAPRPTSPAPSPSPPEPDRAWTRRSRGR